MFDHDVFQTRGEPVPYLPPHRRGFLGPLTAQLGDHVRIQVIRSLTKRPPKAPGGAIRHPLWIAR